MLPCLFQNGNFSMDNELCRIIQTIGDFKQLFRSGWIQRNCLRQESVADHSWGLSFLAMMYAPKHLDILKCLKLSVIHDLGEIEIGDITPQDGISDDEKRKYETAAIKKLSFHLNKSDILSLFEELEAQQSEEAQFVKQLDKIEAVLQAYYYVTRGFMEPNAYQEFYNTSKNKIHLPYLQQLFSQLVPNDQDILTTLLKKDF